MSQINDRFKEYFQTTFFADNPAEFDIFIKGLTKPLPKTIRINTNKISIEDFRARATRNGWTLTDTVNPHMFRIDRDDTTTPLGHTLEHLSGLFYIQELAASMSVHHLCEQLFPLDKGGAQRAGGYGQYIDPNSYSILDIAASPGGKTTQLSEMFPNAFIIGNESNRERLIPLVQNTERMGCDCVALSNYNGLVFDTMTEEFDRVLLDAPCSGEGVGFKSTGGLKFWNVKNIRTIARLQEKLFESGLRALKVGGEMLYSTCTLNDIEDEGVVNAMMEKYPGTFEILFQKRYWPHREETGGFFVCRFRKIVSLPIDEEKITKKRVLSGNADIHSLSREATIAIERFSEASGLSLDGYRLYQFKREIFAIRSHPMAAHFLDSVYFFRYGKRLGSIEDGELVPTAYLGRDFDLPTLPTYSLDPNETDLYLHGHELRSDVSEGWYRIVSDNVSLSIEYCNEKTGRFTNRFPKEWRRG